jgi:hypothetical protein
MAVLGLGILKPGLRASGALAVVRLRERGSVAEKIDILLKQS